MNIIDTRDLIERREEIELELEGSNIAKSLYISLKYELDQINRLESEIDDFEYGAQMIHEDDFVDYAQQLAEDNVPGFAEYMKNSAWPFYAIDWERAANDLQMDYHPVEFLGETYYVSS